MTFLNPWWALLSALVLLLLAVMPWRRAYQASHRIASAFPGTKAPVRLYVKYALVTLSMIALAVAIAQPVKVTAWAEVEAGIVDVIPVIDSSRSMGASATSDPNGPSRLEQTQQILDEVLCPALRSNRMAIVTFAEGAQEHAFLTRDMRFIQQTVRDTVKIGSAGEDGSYLSRGLMKAVHLFDYDFDPSHEKLIILFTDGGHEDRDAKNLEKAVAELKKRGIRIQIVGLGSLTPTPIPNSKLSAKDRYRILGEGKKRDPTGGLSEPTKAGGVVGQLADRAQDSKTWYVHPRTGQIAKTALDHEFLTKFAKDTGAEYSRVASVKDFKLVPLSKETQRITQKKQTELFQIPLCVAFLSLIAAYWSVRTLVWPWLRRSKEKQT